MSKRFLSIMLCILMCINLLPVSAFADFEEETVITETEPAETAVGEEPLPAPEEEPVEEVPAEDEPAAEPEEEIEVDEEIVIEGSIEAEELLSAPRLRHLR